MSLQRPKPEVSRYEYAIFSPYLHPVDSPEHPKSNWRVSVLLVSFDVNIASNQLNGRFRVTVHSISHKAIAQRNEESGREPPMVYAPSREEKEGGTYDILNTMNLEYLLVVHRTSVPQLVGCCAMQKSTTSVTR